MVPALRGGCGKMKGLVLCLSLASLYLILLTGVLFFSSNIPQDFSSISSNHQSVIQCKYEHTSNTHTLPTVKRFCLEEGLYLYFLMCLLNTMGNHELVMCTSLVRNRFVKGTILAGWRTDGQNCSRDWVCFLP